MTVSTEFVVEIIPRVTRVPGLVRMAANAMATWTTFLVQTAGRHAARATLELMSISKEIIAFNQLTKVSLHKNIFYIFT